MRASLINSVTIPYKLYGELTEFSSCGLRKSGRILLATGGRQAVLKHASVPSVQNRSDLNSLMHLQ
jgi:hypothetical protein